MRVVGSRPFLRGKSTDDGNCDIASLLDHAFQDRTLQPSRGKNHSSRRDHRRGGWCVGRAAARNRCGPSYVRQPRNLGVRYDPACQEGTYCALDPRTLFIHGLLDGHGGTCVTMPILYIAIGRRLGYPLWLVQAREHYFVRWDEPGERFNVEATTLGFTPRDDEHFRRWPKPIPDEEIRQGLFLCNLTPREEAAAFYRERGHCWLDHLRTGPALEAFAEAGRLAPKLLGVQCAWAIATILHRGRIRVWARSAVRDAAGGSSIGPER